MQYIKNFQDIRIHDASSVGGKNSSLGQMISMLSDAGIAVPHGFAVTAQAYWYYITYNKLKEPIAQLLHTITDVHNVPLVRKTGAAIRVLIAQGRMPDDLGHEIITAYQALSQQYGRQECDVAVRSSATAEDLPGASFAGQHETFLNVRGATQLIQKCKESMASLFTDRAIVYRHEKGFDHFRVALSVGVQKMVRSDKGISGVAFSLDTETGFKDVVIINALYGLGELLVQGRVVPDEYVVHKPTFKAGYAAIIKKHLGNKDERLVYGHAATQRTIVQSVPEVMQHRWCLSDEHILEVARMTCTIEDAYTALYDRWTPMDIEWAFDGVDHRMYCVQARPETVHATHTNTTQRFYRIADRTTAQLDELTLVTGQSIGSSLATGPARVITTLDAADQVQEGDVLVTYMTDPDWTPVLKRIAALVTESGGRTCHAAIVARELGIPAVVGAATAIKLIKDKQPITVDCSRGARGYVYAGEIPIERQTVEVRDIIRPSSPKIMANSADPDNAFALGVLPIDGVGLARMEFIISNQIQVHPMAFVHPNKITDEAMRRAIAHRIRGYATGKKFFIETLARGIGMIAAGLYPRPVIVRFSDFKSSEYSNLMGGNYFEPHEINPMLGLRGASRYTHSLYRDAFALECAALTHARAIFGLTNIILMIPFVRTVDEARTVLALLKEYGLERGKDGLKIYMMVELPANVFLLPDFAPLFDGFSIGSNDLTQLILGVDRDSTLLTSTLDERNKAVVAAIKLAIDHAHACNKVIGICGQAPSDYPDFADMLIRMGIDSLSLAPDAIIPLLMKLSDDAALTD